MNPQAYGSVGSGVTLLAQALMYFSHWPLTPLTDSQATAFAGLLVLLAASVHGTINAARGTSSTTVPVKDPAPMKLESAPDTAPKPIDPLAPAPGASHA